jgi:hypothetical protein
MCCGGAHKQAGSHIRNVVVGIVQLAREEGVRRGLYRGLSLNYLKTLPNVMIYMSLYDIFKARLLKLSQHNRI